MPEHAITPVEIRWMNAAQQMGLISDLCVRFTDIPKEDRRRAYIRLGKPKLP